MTENHAPCKPSPSLNAGARAKRCGGWAKGQAGVAARIISSLGLQFWVIT